MGRYGRIILKQIQNKMYDDVDWIEVVQDRCTIMEVCVLYRPGNLFKKRE